jgi:hypothetical protein
MHGKVGFMLPAIIAASFSLPRLVCAQETAYGHITLLQTVDEVPHVAPGNLGATASAKVLAEDSIAVTLDVPFVNSNELSAGAARSPSSACKVTTGGYALDPTDPGIKVNESVLLSAYLAGKRVRLDLNGCAYDKPRIVSVTMSASEN